MQSGGATETKRASRVRRYCTALLISSAIVRAITGAAQGQTEATAEIRNNYGTLGLIDIPSARMADDGTLVTQASYQKNTQHYNFVFQVTPWLEGGFVYTGLARFDPLYPVYWDRAFSAKLRLLQESDLFPDIAVGVNDLVGTGVYSGEYLVASKQFGPIDATIGLGWGRNATAGAFRNPLGLLVKSFDNRVYDAHQGQTNTQYFHGPAAIFGGFTWRTPVKNLNFVAEYSSDAYTLEYGRSFTPRNQYNFGLSYNAFDVATLGLNWIYGDSINASITFKLNPGDDPFPVRVGPTPVPIHVRSEREQLQALNNLLDQRNGSAARINVSRENRNALVDALWNGGLTDVAVSGHAMQVQVKDGNVQSSCQAAAQLAARYAVAIDVVDVRSPGQNQRCAVPARMQYAVTTGAAGLTLAPQSLSTIDASAPSARNTKNVIEMIRADAAKQQIQIQAISLMDGEALVYYSNTRYENEKYAIDRLVRVLSNDAPPEIEKFRMVVTAGGDVTNEFDILRSPTERAITQDGRYSLVETGNRILRAPLQNPVLALSGRDSYPNFSWLVFPQFRQELFDPDNPFAVQLLAGVEGVLEVAPGLSIAGEVEASIYDNFGVTRLSDSVLPHVRTDWTTYFSTGKNGIGELDAQYHFRLAPDVFARVRAGYLESMFGGIGGEVLWQPLDQRWALGVDMYEVQRRKFDRLFGFQPYRAFTSHVAVYYASPWYGLDFSLRAGQYLAGDRGVTFEVKRRFATGVEIGVFATKTNITAAQFGEGSFDKGFMIRIPLSWTLPVNSLAEVYTIIRPLQRDGGQRLQGDASLYAQLRRSSYGEVLRTGDIVVP